MSIFIDYFSRSCKVTNKCKETRHATKPTRSQISSNHYSITIIQVYLVTKGLLPTHIIIQNVRLSVKNSTEKNMFSLFTFSPVVRMRM